MLDDGHWCCERRQRRKQMKHFATRRAAVSGAARAPLPAKAAARKPKVDAALARVASAVPA